MLDQEYINWMKSKEDKVQPIVYKKLERLLEDHPLVEKVYLTGSYLRGDWIDEHSEEWEVHLKQRITGKTKLSDVDFFTIPSVVNTSKDYDIVGDSKNKKLIYDSGRTII